MITAERFEKATGMPPEQDDLERANCPLAGVRSTDSFGHLYCGWCGKHDKPRFICGCRAL